MYITSLSISVALRRITPSQKPLRGLFCTYSELRSLVNITVQPLVSLIVAQPEENGKS